MNRSVFFWGVEKKYLKACEEMGELQQVICKALAGSPVDPEKLVEETADVLFMVLQIRSFLGPIDVDAVLQKKLKRLEAALNHAEAADASPRVSVPE